MNNLGYKIIAGGVLVCVLVALMVSAMWVKLLMIGIGVVLIFCVWVWMKMHTLEFIQNRIVKSAKRYGCKCVRKNGDFYVIRDMHYYTVRFVVSGWRVNRAVIDFETEIPYYDRLEKWVIDSALAGVNTEYEYVKMYAKASRVISEYMGMVEYAPDSIVQIV